MVIKAPDHIHIQIFCDERLLIYVSQKVSKQNCPSPLPRPLENEGIPVEKGEGVLRTDVFSTHREIQS